MSRRLLWRQVQTADWKSARTMACVRRLHLLLLRHTESENNFAGADDGGENGRAVVMRQADPPLSERGFAQSEACASWIHGEFGQRISHIHVSPMTRTMQTALPLVAALPDVPVLLHTDAFEVGGCFNGPRADDGRGHSEVHGMDQRQIMRMISSIQVTPEDFAHPLGGWWRGGCELEGEAHTRASRVCEWAWAQVPAEPCAEGEQPPVVVLVTHGFFMSYLLQAMFGMQPASKGGPSFSFLSANGAVWLLELRIRSDAEPARSLAVLGAGRTDHIPTPLRSGQKLQGFCIPKCME